MVSSFHKIVAMGSKITVLYIGTHTYVILVVYVWLLVLVCKCLVGQQTLSPVCICYVSIKVNKPI